MKLLFDDTFRYIESDCGSIDIKCSCSYQYNELVEILLTKVQLYKYIGDTKRIFTVPENKIQLGIEYMKDNIWNESN